MALTYVLIAIWAATLLLAAWSDLRSFRIPNLFPAILILLFPVVHGLAGFNATLWQNFFHFLTALVVGMTMFARGWVGGGDAKLYAAAALWFNWAGAVALIFYTSLAGLLLAILMIGARMAGLRKDVAKEDRRLPYGVAIAVGAIGSAAWTGWSGMFPAVSL